MIKKPYTKSLEIAIMHDSYICLGQKKEQYAESVELMRQFTEYENNVKKTKEEKNKLEALLFRVGEMTTDENFLRFAKDDEVLNITDSKKEIGEWFEGGEAHTANYSAFQEKSKVFDSVLDVIKLRREEHGKREQATSAAHTQLDSIEKNIREMNKTRAWIPESEREAALKVVQASRQWLLDTTEEQSKLSLNENPVLKIKTIRAKVNLAQEEIYRLRGIKKEGDKSKGSAKEKKFDTGDFKFKMKDLIGVSAVDGRAWASRLRIW